MAKPTNTLSVIRRSLCIEMNMPFFTRFPSGYSNPTSQSTTEKLADSNLAQSNDYWNNSWIYFSGSSGSNAHDVRMISDFIAGSGGSNAYLVPEYNFDAAPSSDDEYEIHNLFSAVQIHNAINRSIVEGFPSFFDTINDESLCVRKDTLEYDLTGIATRPWLVTKVFIEQNSYDNVIDCLANAVTSTSIDVLSSTYSALTTLERTYGKLYVGVYDGQGVGQVREVTSTSVVGSTYTFNFSAWSTNPNTTTSKIKIWNTYQCDEPFYPLQSVRFDAKEYPTKMWLPKMYTNHLGMRLRIQYIAKPATLTTDSDETVIPMEYVLNKAIGHLAATKVVDNRNDRQRWQVMEQIYTQKAEMYRNQNAWRVPDVTLWMEEDNAGEAPLENPLSWSN